MENKDFEFSDMLFWMAEEVAETIKTGKVVTSHKERIGPPCSYFYYVVFRDGSCGIISGIDWYAVMYRALMNSAINDVNIQPAVKTDAEKLMVQKGLSQLGITEELIKAVKRPITR